MSKAGSRRNGVIRVYAGNYHDIIRFESRVDVPDEGGGRIETWKIELDNVGADVDPITDPEQFASMQTKPTVGYSVRCRYFPGLDSSWRIYSYSDDETYAIISAFDEGSKNREYIITAIKQLGRF